MAKAFNVEIVGLKTLQANLAKLPATIKKESGAVIEAGAKLFERNAKRDAPMNEGILAKQISYKKIDTLIYEIVSGSRYAPYIEFGTKSKFQPIAGVDASEFKGKGQGGNIDEFFLSILDWVKRKGLADTYSTGIRKNAGGKKTGYRLDIETGKRKRANDAQAYDLAFAIMMSILKKGIKAQPSFYKQAPIVKKQVESELEKVIGSLEI